MTKKVELSREQIIGAYASLVAEEETTVYEMLAAVRDYLKAKEPDFLAGGGGVPPRLGKAFGLTMAAMEAIVPPNAAADAKAG